MQLSIAVTKVTMTKLSQRLDSTEAQHALQLTYDWAMEGTTSNARTVADIIDAMPSRELIELTDEYVVLYAKSTRTMLGHILSLLPYWHGYVAQVAKESLRRHVVELNAVINKVVEVDEYA